MSDIKVFHPDPELERERYESDRARAIERRAIALRIVPKDFAGLILAILSPITTGYSVTAFLAVAGFPAVAVGSVALFIIIGAIAAWFYTRGDAVARGGFYVIMAGFIFGVIGGLL